MTSHNLLLLHWTLRLRGTSSSYYGTSARSGRSTDFGYAARAARKAEVRLS